VNPVVDKQFQVVGNEDIHVIGSSNFPISHVVNPTLTIVQESLRFANQFM